MIRSDSAAFAPPLYRRLAARLRFASGAALGLALLFGALSLRATGFLERFALSDDREAVLAELLPGSDEAFYYRALHRLNQGDAAGFKGVMAAWQRERKNNWPPAGARELLNREAVLLYPADPQGSLKYLRELLGLHFNHSRTDASRVADLPSAFDNALVSRGTLLKKVLSEQTRDVSRIDARGYHLLQEVKLTADQRFDLLKKLQHPDFKGLEELIAADLRERKGAHFGDIPLHARLTLAQLEALARQNPELRRSENFINACLARQAPPDEVDLVRELDELDAYYGRMWQTLAGVIPDFNSRKANLLHNWLQNDLKRGRVDQARFKEYLKFPRNAPYAPPPQERERGFAVDFSRSFNDRWLPPIGNEEPLVRKILLMLLKDAENTAEFEPFLKTEFLREVFAEAKVTSAQGAPEEWAAWMSRAKFDALKRRVDVDFADDNPVVLGPDDPVALSAYVKNVATLLVKVYELDTLNCYRETGAPVDLAMNLNGLTATYEQRHEYAESEFSRVRREFQFPELRSRGVSIIELIGNGRSSRALVQKGHLKVAEAVTAGGHAFRVYDEANNPVAGCVGWFNGAPFAAQADGAIYIPFAGADAAAGDPFAPAGGAEQSLVVARGDFATLVKFAHKPERYALQAGFYVDREALLAGEPAETVVRPHLSLNGCRVPLSLLQKPKLRIASTDLDGVESESVVAIDTLSEESDFIHKFRVPERCVSLAFTLEGRIENLALNREQELSTGESFEFNAALRTADVAHVFLNRHAGGYTLEVRGRNGEAMADVPVNLALRHRLFTQEVHAVLKSDRSGAVQLGRLAEIERLSAAWEGIGNRRRSWRLEADARTQVERVHGSVGAPLRMAVAEGVDLGEDFSLIETRRGAYLRDWRGALSLKEGCLVLEGLPAGDYELFLHRESRRVSVTVTAARDDGRRLVSSRAGLELPRLKPLAVAAVAVAGDTLRIELADSSQYARVHLFATRYLPEFDLFRSLETPRESLSATAWSLPGCYYKSGRDIGDEYRYILERQHAAKFPGSMLERPGLLIAPWSRQESSAEKERLVEGGEFESVSDSLAKSRHAGALMRRGGGVAARADAIGSCDFLGGGAAVLGNLKPDARGVVSVPLADLRGNSYLRIAAVDPESLVVRDFVLPAAPLRTRELRLTENLQPEAAFLEKQRSSSLKAGESFEIRGAVSARFEIYDTVGSLYRLFSALSGDETLREFAFVTEWNRLAEERKRELYSEYACHELNLFLYFKDREFFTRVVKSFIANKRDKRFVDHWLLGGDLTHYCGGLPYARLNAAERALLAQRVAVRKELTTRDLRERTELLPVDQERLNRLFDTALQGRALDAETSPTSPTAVPAEEAVAAGGAPGRMPAFARTSGVDAAMDKVESAVMRKRDEAAKPAAAPLVALADASVALAEADVGALAAADPFGDGLAVRDGSRALFQRLESTKEWAENNYYELPVERQNADLIPPCAFWTEYAEHPGESGFVSGHAAEAANSFAEMMLALAVTDLPFESAEHREVRDAAGFRVTAASPALVYYRQVHSGERDPDGQALVAQRFFQLADRYRYEGGERYDKLVTEEFLKRVVYGAQVVLTNPAGSRMKLRILLQIPQGALPVQGGFTTKGFYITLEPYATHTQEYFFYFPESGRYAHYPVTVSREGRVAGQAEPFVFTVVDQLSEVDRESWAWLSQNGTEEQVLDSLRRSNIHRVNLSEIAWRVKERAFFAQVTALLSERGLYDPTLWSYSIHHNDPERIAEYLERSPLAGQCGLWIDAPLLKIDPIDHNLHEHLEYAPLVNPRAHRVGAEHRILNTRFRANYERFMKVLSYKPALDDEDRLAVVWSMTLQDRVADALAWFGRVDRKRIAEQVQYDYLGAYLAFYRSDVEGARRIASGYEQYHVDRWRKRFELVLAQAREIQGEAALSVADRRSRDQAQSALAATEPALEMKVESGVIRLKGANIAGCTLNFYPMDIELLFSRAPFVEAGGANFSSVRPALAQPVEIGAVGIWTEVALPPRFASKNVMIEAVAAGVRRSQVYYANTLNVQMVERYGQLTVRHAESGAPLPAVYVKVYARMDGGEVRFFKDGYTDLRGRFDYVSLNGGEIESVEKLAVLVLSDTLGAVVREALPPARVR